MAAKPGSVPTWATDTNFSSGLESGLPTKVAVSSGKRAQGWLPAEEPASTNLNYEQNLLGQWLQYISEGHLTGVVTISNGFHYGTGDSFAFATPVVTLTDSEGKFISAMVGGSVTIAGATTPANNGVFTVTGQTATTLTWNNASAVAEAFTGTWTTNVAGSLRTFGAAIIDGALTGGSTAAFTGNVTAPDFRYTTAQTKFLPASMSVDDGIHTKKLGASSFGQAGWTIGASTSPITWPIPIEVGCTITGYTIYCRKRTNGSATIAARLWVTTGTNGIEGGGGAMGAGSSSSANAPGYITLSESGLTAAPAAAEQMYLVFTPSGSITTAADELFHAVVTYKRL